MSLPFVHTARRFYRSNCSMKIREDSYLMSKDLMCLSKPIWISQFRGRRSRNKVSVGEPSEGSLTLKETSFNRFLRYYSISKREVLRRTFENYLVSKPISLFKRNELSKRNFHKNLLNKKQRGFYKQKNTAFNNGYLGLLYEEERSKVR